MRAIVLLFRQGFTTDVHEWTIRLQRWAMFGVATSDVEKSTYNLRTKGFFMPTDGVLCSGPPSNFSGKVYRGSDVPRGALVTVHLDMDARTLSFSVNGTDHGVAFARENFPTGPLTLYPAVEMYYNGD